MIEGNYRVATRYQKEDTTWQSSSLSPSLLSAYITRPTWKRRTFFEFCHSPPPGKGRPRDSSPPSLMWESHTLERGRGTISNFIRILTRVSFARFFGRVSARAGRMKICIAVGRTRRLGGAPLPPHSPPPPFYLVMPFIISCSVSLPPFFISLSVAHAQVCLPTPSVVLACIYLSPAAAPASNGEGTIPGQRERDGRSQKKNYSNKRKREAEGGWTHGSSTLCTAAHNRSRPVSGLLGYR